MPMRNQLVESLKRELVGPDIFSHKVQKNGEEILDISPRERYATGILYPQKLNAEPDELLLDFGDEKNEIIINDESEELMAANGNSEELALEEFDSINLSTIYMQSALGFSCILSQSVPALDIQISAGVYSAVSESVEQKPFKQYYRSQIKEIIHLRREDIPTFNQRRKEYTVRETKLKLIIQNRAGKTKGLQSDYFTFMLVNTNQTINEIHDSDCYFQVALSVQTTHNFPCFLPLSNRQYAVQHEEDESLSLLYRKMKAYAIGHGCSVKWEERDDRCVEIHTEIIPLHEVQSIVPAHFDDLTISMRQLVNSESDRTQLNVLQSLCNKYEAWIDLQSHRAYTEVLDEERPIAERHIILCRKALDRMQKGLKILQQDDQCLRAFCLMNEAMLLQQLRYNLPLRTWKIEQGIEKIGTPSKEIDINDETTWPGYSEVNKKTKYGIWRPFQIAFIIMNINAFFDSSGNERKIADLIWFPTGGGKTEAYLGLASFVIFLRRLRDETDDGTAIIMRYTLRLLTAQQFLRASSLICACEYIRQRDLDLGKTRITIGLWVGEASTPNERRDATERLDKMHRSPYISNPFVLLKCPWCGAQMGTVQNSNYNKVYGYVKVKEPVSTVRYKCPDEECYFSKMDNLLPLLIIDEDIYDFPPTLLIGTVDKFAMLVWRPQARSLFGIRDNGVRVKPPELIIQDELHLISSTLGSIVGHYETMIQELATCNSDDNKIPPKIIASTATVTRAKERICALYGMTGDEISIFPPQGIEMGDTFFSELATSTPGRLYAGIFPAGLISKITAQVRIMAALLQGTQDATVTCERNRDPYWTIIEYFNSLRELGTAATLITSYLRDYLTKMFLRKRSTNLDSSQIKSRKRNNYIELTSRIAGHQIPKLLQKLEYSYPPADFARMPVDICLATNMISVGLDISRLGLMVVVGQPKLTSEYIQTTSRIGRSSEGPGLVVVLYNPFRSRDRSYYEQFHQYHSRLYEYVEPSSVTPFAAPVQERALHAILVGLIRFLGTKHNADVPRPMPSSDLIQKVKDIIIRRAEIVQNDESAQCETLLNARIAEWRELIPPIYGNFNNKEQQHCLIYPAGTMQRESISDRAWPTLSSMRDVEKSCELEVIARYPEDLEG